MACPPIRTGERYLETVLQHIDCQAQSIGGLGYLALSDPGSTISIALTAILVIFVALFAIRIALGYPLAGHDLAGHAIRLVIVLTLATSWPAWRVIGYDVLVSGPAEVAQTIGSSAQLPGSDGSLAGRLQRVDEGLAVLNETGAGRRGVQTGDWFQLGFTRSAFLTGTIGPLALVRLTGGILIALAPLVAGLLLFGFTRSIFSGWAKALVAVFLSTITVSLLLAVELALLEPWLQEVLRLRAADQEALSAPTEGLTMTLAFALMCFGAIAFSAWIAFNASIATRLFASSSSSVQRAQADNRSYTSSLAPGQERALHSQAVAASVTRSMERDGRLGRDSRVEVVQGAATHREAPAAEYRSGAQPRYEPLGSTYRRPGMTVSRSRTSRDETR